VGTKKFIKNVKSFLELKDFTKENKKKSLKNLLRKLNRKKISVTKSLEVSLSKKEKKEFQEDLDIISLQMKKGEKLLYNLSFEK